MCLRELSVFMQDLPYVTVVCTGQEATAVQFPPDMFVGCEIDVWREPQTDTKEHLTE